jgi:FdhE protein
MTTERDLGKTGERVRQLKGKRPGYAEILDFYAKVRELQDRSKSSLKTDPIKFEKERKDLLAREGFPLMRKEDFPLDIEASIRLFRSLCRIGKAANPRMAGQVEKIRDLLGKKKIDLKKLFDGGVKEETIGQVAAESGLDKSILSFFLQSSIRPSIEAGVEQLRGEVDPETWRKGHCPACGSPPSLSLLKGVEGKRYLLCSCCGSQWRADRLRCPACDNKERESLGYFCAEGEEAFRIDLCDRCHRYIKTIDYRSLEESDPCLEDLATLHLDILASEKGFQRPDGVGRDLKSALLGIPWRE